MPSSGVLQVPFGILALLHMTWMTALGSPPQYFLDELASR
jgi:hypothetical protein